MNLEQTTAAARARFPDAGLAVVQVSKRNVTTNETVEQIAVEVGDRTFGFASLDDAQRALSLALALAGDTTPPAPQAPAEPQAAPPPPIDLRRRQRSVDDSSETRVVAAAMPLTSI